MPNVALRLRKVRLVAEPAKSLPGPGPPGAEAGAAEGGDGVRGRERAVVHEDRVTGRPDRGGRGHPLAVDRDRGGTGRPEPVDQPLQILVVDAAVLLRAAAGGVRVVHRDDRPGTADRQGRGRV